MSSLMQRIYSQQPHDDCTPLSVLWDRRVDVSALPSLHHIDQGRDTALILFSSGTTGLPKGVRLAHRSLVFTSRLFGYHGRRRRCRFCHTFALLNSISRFAGQLRTNIYETIKGWLAFSALDVCASAAALRSTRCPTTRASSSSRCRTSSASA